MRFWEFYLNPWDTAAGALLVEEAGGKITRFDGTPFRLDSSEVLATNGLLHAELMAQFADMFAGRGTAPDSHAGGVCGAAGGTVELSRRASDRARDPFLKLFSCGRRLFSRRLPLLE